MESGRSSHESDCRQCTSFSDFLKNNQYFNQKKSSETKSQANTDPVNRRTDCPIDKDQLGSCSWALLHTIATKYPKKPSEQHKKDMRQFLQLFSKLYPCEMCAEDMRKDLETHQPEVDSEEKLSNWLCEMHNRVNKKIGKQPFDCRLVRQRWRDGWADGSCDF